MDNDISHDDVIPIANDINFIATNNIVNFLHEIMDTTIDSEDIDIVSFLK